ncbi:condensin complex protein MksE [Desulfotalea psychrophila]|uniref:DUF4194 domain-containing protein n=1 Tax=Desulfotalea psychrophila (strain LSv54 / DSM 12343) TaxID=177439 RepID=Q6AK38_DESPS|nr:hypothetical protein [Desulfotalea psychrophila]CAG37288.1 hypothetical protein DP2559 [Desulfotalea psychrophila LSv54]
MKNKYDLPYLQEIYQELLKGRHISFSEGKLFFALQNDLQSYADLFECLGFELVAHPKEFYYLKKHGKSLNNQIKQMLLFVFVLIDDLDRKEADLEAALFDNSILIETLPHFKTEKYKDYMKEVGVEDEQKLFSIIETLQKYGFLTTLGKVSFQFKTPVYRLLDLCTTVLKDSEEQEILARGDEDEYRAN